MVVSWGLSLDEGQLSQSREQPGGRQLPDRQVHFMERPQPHEPRHAATFVTSALPDPKSGSCPLLNAC
jgi:hypothetical protein